MTRQYDRNPNRARRLLWLAAAALPLIAALPAAAQQRVGSDGRANDANNRIGSGGYNDNGPRAVGVTGNNIVTGNVTGGKEFRGFVPYRDSREFTGYVAGRGMDNFIKNSSGSGQSYGAGGSATGVQPFYGSSLATPPPPGFQQGSAGTYLPALSVGPAAGDARLNRPLDRLPIGVPRPGQLNQPGPVDPTASPRGNTLGGLDVTPLGSGPVDYSNVRPGESSVRLDPATLQRMREELDRATRDADSLNPLQGGQPSTIRPGVVFTNPQPGATQNQNVPTQVGPRPAGTGAGASAAFENRPLNAGALGTTTVNLNEPLSADVREGGSFQVIRRPAAPTRQSAQYAALREKLDKYYEDRLKGDARFADDLARLKAKRDADHGPATRPQGPEAFGVPDYAKISRELVEASRTIGAGDAAVPAANPRARSVRPEPIKIASLAVGVKAPGLARFLTEAEGLMKQGKFTSALDQYDAAEQVAPNNPLVWLGRANAELGAAYYGKAEQHLRQAFTSDPTILMGQYDLVSMIGQERVSFLVKDLKQMARAQEKLVRPVFLLAYVAYNTGNEELAATYLDAVEARSGGADHAVRTLREHWRLARSPATQPQ